MSRAPGSRSSNASSDSASASDADHRPPTSADDVDDTLIVWFLGLTPIERLHWAEEMANTIRILREAPEVREE